MLKLNDVFNSIRHHVWLKTSHTFLACEKLEFKLKLIIRNASICMSSRNITSDIYFFVLYKKI